MGDSCVHDAVIDDVCVMCEQVRRHDAGEVLTPHETWVVDSARWVEYVKENIGRADEHDRWRMQLRLDARIEAVVRKHGRREQVVRVGAAVLALAEAMDSQTGVRDAARLVAVGINPVTGFMDEVSTADERTRVGLNAVNMGHILDDYQRHCLPDSGVAERVRAVMGCGHRYTVIDSCPGCDAEDERD